MYKRNRLAPVLPKEPTPRESAPLESEALEPASLESALPQEPTPRESALDDKALAALDEFMSRRSNLDTFTARMADGTLIGKLVARLPEDVAAKAIDQVTEWINLELRKTAPEQEPEPALESAPESISEPALKSVPAAQGAMEELTYDNCPECPEEVVCY